MQECGSCERLQAALILLPLLQDLAVARTDDVAKVAALSHVLRHLSNKPPLKRFSIGNSPFSLPEGPPEMVHQNATDLQYITCLDFWGTVQIYSIPDQLQHINLH